MATKRRHTNNFKKKKRGNKRTAKNMRGGKTPVCKDLSQLGDKNIFKIFKSSIQLPKIMTR